MRVGLCVIFSVCCFVAGGFGSRDFRSKNFVPNPNVVCAFKCQDFRALAQKNRELQKSFVESNKRFEFLKREVNQIKNFLADERFSELLRGPPRQNGGNGTKEQLGHVQVERQRQPGEAGQNRVKDASQNGGKVAGVGEFIRPQEQVVWREDVNQTLPQGQPGQPGSDGGQRQSLRGRRHDSPPTLITSCSDVMAFSPAPRSPKQTICPPGNSTKVEVLCDFESDGGGWTVIQKRSTGPPEEYNRIWDDYVQGFGSLDSDFWLGLENIHALTKNNDQELRIELEDFEGNKKWAKYSNFSISDVHDFFRLTISGFSRDSTAGDSMTSESGLSNNGMKFTTKDKYNSLTAGRNCGEEYESGWWFPRACGLSYLNGPYQEKGLTQNQNHAGIVWASWRGFKYSLAKTEMKIRTRRSESVSKLE